MVFQTQIRKSLRNPGGDGAVVHPELKDYGPTSIQNAFQQLEHRTIDGKLVIQMPTEYAVAQFSDHRADGAIESDDGKCWKRAKRVFAPLTVRKELFTSFEKQPETPIDQFIKDMLIISGEYVDRRVFSGMDSANPKMAVTDNCYVIRKNDTVHMRIENPHCITRSVKEIIYGDDFDDSDDEVDYTIFPPDKAVLEFDELSRVETKVAAAARARVPLEPEIEEIFKSAYTTFK